MGSQQGRTRKVLATTLVLGLVAGLATIASFAAFSSTTSNGANDFDAGTVHIDDNDGSVVMYDVDTQKPGVDTVKCINVTYSGSLAAGVKFYGAERRPRRFDRLREPDGRGGHAGHTVRSRAALGSRRSNTLYNGDARWLHDGTHELRQWTHHDGRQRRRLAAAADHRVYRFTVSVQDNNAANGGATALTSGNHTFHWQAQNLP